MGFMFKIEMHVAIIIDIVGYYITCFLDERKYRCEKHFIDSRIKCNKRIC
jgi:hypothetical protein